MQTGNYVQFLQGLHAGEVIGPDDSRIAGYAHDASIFVVTPDCVVIPKNREDIKKIVKAVSESKDTGQKISLSVRGAGTCMSGGSLTESIVVDMQKSNTIGEVVRHDSLDQRTGKIENIKTVTTEPGVLFRDMEPVVLSKNLEMPVYPASKHLASIGGMFNNNCGGEKSLRHGKAANWIVETKQIFADANEYTVKPLTKQELESKIKEQTYEGVIYKNIWELLQNNAELIEKNKPKVNKNSAGYYLWNVYNRDTQIFDLNQLLVGSQGTLSVTTEITWRLKPTEPNAKMVVVMLPEISKLGELVNVILKYNPSSVESYDDASMKLAVAHFADFFAQLGLVKAIKLGIQFMPELIMMIKSGAPKLILVAEFTGNIEDEVTAQAKNAHEELQKFGYPLRIPKSDAEEQKYWTIRRESFNLLRKHLAGKRTAPFIDDICVNPSYLPEFLPKLQTILDRNGLTYTIAGHAGDGNFHIIPLMDFTQSAERNKIVPISEEVYQLVKEYHGSITAEHNDGIIRTPFLQYMFDEKMLALFEKVKNIFDPKNIFNPGKKTHGDKKFLQNHITNS